jgi:hypothetical protein
MRKGYMTRPAIFLNVLLLWQIFFPIWDTLPKIIQVYLNIGTFIGVIALISYITGESISTEAYKVFLVLYGSLSIILLIFALSYLGVPLI